MAHPSRSKFQSKWVSARNSRAVGCPTRRTRVWVVDVAFDVILTAAKDFRRRRLTPGPASYRPTSDIIFAKFMKPFLQAAVLLFATLALSGCPHAPLAYRLVPLGSNPLLLPPKQYININANAPLFDLTIKNARHAKSSPADCDITGDLVTLHWEGRTANVELKQESDLVVPESAAQGPQRMFLDPLMSLEKFRNDLENLETNGCLHPGESRRLNIALSEKLPLSTQARYRMRFGSFELHRNLRSRFRFPSQHQWPCLCLRYEWPHKGDHRI